MKILFIVVVVIHALIHIMGFVKAFNLAELSQLTKPISKILGVIWMATALLFLTALVLFLLKDDKWWIVGFIAIAISQIVITNSWSDAKWGTIANIIILLFVLDSFMGTLPSGFSKVYKMEVDKKHNTKSDISLLLKKDLQHLPTPVNKYLHYVGAVGNPKITNFRSVTTGKMKSKIEDKWMNIKSQQFNFCDDPSRFLCIVSEKYGIRMDGLYMYKDNKATMLIRLASANNIVFSYAHK